MALPDSLHALLDQAAYPHACRPIELIETHISWVLLTGDFVYKLKKPVKFAFLDFSTPKLREHFCHEELRCNRAFAPALYLAVVPVIRHADGTLRMGGTAGADDEVVEWAVQMRQFDPAAQLDRLLEHGTVTTAMLAAFGTELARLHADLPQLQGADDQLETRTLRPVHDNFTEIAATGLQQAHAQSLADVQQASTALEQHLLPLLNKRLRNGYVRECHGDLHLSNLALIDNTVTAFDCLEFNPMLRWIDTLSDVAFLFMDCSERRRDDLAYAFLNGYLNESGDYQGAALLSYFAAYRSLVRSKVAALRWEQTHDTATEQRCVRHVEWALALLSRPVGRLVLMCGLSGAGKSYAARQLALLLPAIHLRSDVARKTLAGLDPLARTESAVGEGLYDTHTSAAVFDYLQDVTADLLRNGDTVIVDATFIERQRRQAFLALAAKAGATAHIVLCQAPLAVLRERIGKRATGGQDPSEANLAVLEAQLAKFEPPGEDEPVLQLSTEGPLEPALAALVSQLPSHQKERVSDTLNERGSTRLKCTSSTPAGSSVPPGPKGSRSRDS